MRRIMIIGGPGSGKSTLALALGARLGLPVVHIDPMYWAAGWVQRPAAQTVALVAAAAAGPSWVFEGNHSASYACRADRADLIVFLDLPRLLRLVRVLRRVWHYAGQTRPDMPQGCPERLDFGFLLFTLRWERRPALGLLDRVQGQTPTLHLKTSAQVRRFLADPAIK